MSANTATNTAIMATYRDFDEEPVRLLNIKSFENFRRMKIENWVFDTYTKNGGKSFSRIKMSAIYGAHADKLFPAWIPVRRAGRPAWTDAKKQTVLAAVKAMFHLHARQDVLWDKVKAHYPDVDINKNDALSEFQVDSNTLFPGSINLSEDSMIAGTLSYDPNNLRASLRASLQADSEAFEQQVSQEIRNTLYGSDEYDETESESESETEIDVSDCSEPALSEDDESAAEEWTLRGADGAVLIPY